MPSCILRYCTSHTRSMNKSLGVTFHRFLKPGHHNRAKWIAYVQKDRSEETWLPSDYTYICSKHFKTTDFYTTKAGRRFLKKSAVPGGDPDESSEDECTCTPSPLSSRPRKIKLLRKQKIKAMRQNQGQKNKISLSNVVKKLKEKFPIDREIENNLLNKAKMIELYENTLKKLGRPKSKLKYSACVRKFALTLNYYSTAAYRYVRQTYSNLLPHPRTLSRWYSSVNAEPGFTNESFTVLKTKCQKTTKPLVCSLIFNEIALQKQKLFRNKNLACVNFGIGPQYESEEVATRAVVFMLVSLQENWKIPVGYFLTAGTTAETKATLIKICLKKCHEVGVVVANLTFDGCSVNFRTAEILGCKIDNEISIKSYFLHPCTSENVYVFIDPGYIVKLIRNTLEYKKIFFDENDQKVRWELFVNLNKLQQNESLTFANKISPRHIYFRNQMMKVKLATQMLSMTVAQALKLCDEVLKSSKFRNSEGTIKFITIMNNYFDVFNSQKGNQGFKRPIDFKNKRKIFEFLNTFKQYILALRLNVKRWRIIRRRNRNPRIVLNISKKKVTKSANKTGFLGAVMCIESLKRMYAEFVEKKNLLKYISMNKISLDHLELFFGCIRRYGGNNTNPNVIQFRAAYKKILSHLELRCTFSGNCIPLDNFAILTSSSVNVINDTSPMNIRRSDENFQVLEKENLMNSDLQAEVNCKILIKKINYEQLVDTSRLIVGYISGYVARELTKLLKCEECITVSTTTKKLWHHKLIMIKDMGGLCYSSVDAFYVCLKTEAVIRQLIKERGGRSLLPEFSKIGFVIVNTLIHFVNSNIFMSLHSHSLLQPSTCNHRTHLIRAIIETYAKIRLRYEAATDTEIQFKIKQRKLPKLILFERN